MDPPQLGLASSNVIPGAGKRSRVIAPILLAAFLAATAFAGCSSASTAESTAPDASTTSATSITGLPVGRVSSRVVQPQPAPGSCHARGSGVYSLPDPHCTPGAISPAVTEANIQSTICRSGYT